MNVKRFDQLSTSFVNLRALLRFLQDQEFNGTVHVVINDYEADVLMYGSEPPHVSERASSPATPSAGEGAMERLMVHAREPGGIITVLENQPATAVTVPEDPPDVFEAQQPLVEQAPVTEMEWSELLDIAGRVVAAVERAVGTAGNFESTFRSVRIEIGDDYPFLDPTTDGMNYKDKRIELRDTAAPGAFINGLSDALRRVVNKFAIGKETNRVRETVAIELAVAARMRANGLGPFTKQLDRIAGTRVL